ncbi:hypothetical protein AgCh_032321 [Apium graveolens]
MLPDTILRDINKQLRKDSDLSSKVDSLDTRLKKLDEKIEKSFGPIEKQDKAFSHFSQLRPISANEINLGNLERGQPSAIKSPTANVIFQPKRNYPMNSDKNPLDLVYETPKPDEKKVLGRSIAFFKDPTDSVLKKRIAKIYRNGKLICVVAGHPQFAEAMKEEKVRLKQQQKHSTTESKMPAEIAESVNEEKQEEPKQTKKSRLKFRPKRKLDFDEDKEEYMPTQSSTSRNYGRRRCKREEYMIKEEIKGVQDLSLEAQGLKESVEKMHLPQGLSLCYNSYMRRSISAGNLEFDPEIEHTFRALRREAKQRKEKDKMGERALVIDNQDEPSIRDHGTPNLANCIYKTPAISATQFTINLSLIQMVSNPAFEGDTEREC